MLDCSAESRRGVLHILLFYQFYLHLEDEGKQSSVKDNTVCVPAKLTDRLKLKKYSITVTVENISEKLNQKSGVKFNRSPLKFRL